MKSVAWVLPVALGLLSVLQAGLNERLMAKIGLTATVVLNSIVLLLVALCAWYAFRFFPSFLPKQLQTMGGTVEWYWWFLVPGMLGYFLVAGIPVSFSLLGAGRTMVILVASQIIIGLFWEYYYQDLPISMKQLAGAGLALVASFLTAGDS